MILPVQSIALASTTFVGQNLGDGKAERARHGVRTALLMSIGTTICISVLVMSAAPHLVTFFNGKAEVVAYGSMFLRFMTPFYVLCCFNQIYSGALRGSGNSQIPMAAMLFSFVLFRQCYLYIVSNYISNTILPLAMGYPAGWGVCSIIISSYYHKTKLNNSKLVLKN